MGPQGASPLCARADRVPNRDGLRAFPPVSDKREELGSTVPVAECSYIVLVRTSILTLFLFQKPRVEAADQLLRPTQGVQRFLLGASPDQTYR